MAAGIGSQHSIHKCRSHSANPQAAEQPQRHYCSSVLGCSSASTLSSRSYSKWHLDGMQPEQRCCLTCSLSPFCCSTKPAGACLFFQLNAHFTSLQGAHGCKVLLLLYRARQRQQHPANLLQMAWQPLNRASHRSHHKPWPGRPCLTPQQPLA